MKHMLLDQVHYPLLFKYPLANAVAHQRFILILLLVKINENLHHLPKGYPLRFKVLKEAEHVDRFPERPDHFTHVSVAERLGVKDNEFERCM